MTGTLIGRVPNAKGTSYLAGAATLGTILVAHRAITMLRTVPRIGRLVEHPPRVLVVNGEVRDDQPLQAGVTRAHLYAELRQQGVGDLGEVGYAIFEQRGQLSVIHRHNPSDGDSPPPNLVRNAVDRAAAGA